MQGQEFSPSKQDHLFQENEGDYAEMGDMQLFRTRVTTTLRDLKTMQINLAYNGMKQILFMGFTKDLDFDPLEWTWEGLGHYCGKSIFQLLRSNQL
jgi:hypothetical protein